MSDLFEAAAERIAYAGAMEGSGKPLSQVRAELVKPTPEPLPRESLFGPRTTATVCYHGTPLADDCSKCASEIPGARKRKRA